MIRAATDGENMRRLILALPLVTAACVYVDTFKGLFTPPPDESSEQSAAPIPATPKLGPARWPGDAPPSAAKPADTRLLAAELPIKHSATRYRIRGDRATACRNVKALLALSEPDARERLGDLNWTRIPTLGECHEIGKSRPLMICYTTERVSFMAQIFETPAGETAGRCYFMLTQRLADDEGNAPAPGISN
jgi:hypothetical protein